MNNPSSEWVSQLLRRYVRVVEHSENPPAPTLFSLNTLQLADAVLKKSQLNESDPDHALQVAVIGPTQSGKSTLVNLILDKDAAGISALAGFTVHAQGYATGCTSEQLDTLQSLMHPLTRTTARSLDATDLNAFVLESVASRSNALITPAVIWDTPDFDSIDASTYTHAVLNTVAIADIVVLMVSKDKYGDKSVWDMLSLIQPLQKPLLVCINKLDLHDEQAVSAAFSARYDEQFGSAKQPAMVLFPFVKKAQDIHELPFPSERLEQLAEKLQAARNRINRAAAASSANAFISQHREHWLRPLIEEQQSQAEWHFLVEQAAQRALQSYTDDYLNNSDKYETFNRALAELLTLLEIPGLATTLARTRQLVTWPARKLLGVGRSAVEAQFNRSRKATKTIDEEAEALSRALNSALVNLQGELLNQPQNPFWSSMNQTFREHEARLRENFHTQSRIAREQFSPQIEAAAQQLYEQLQSQPTLLNSLRAARVTTDAAGVALALKSGGLAPADLILAPAMLSVTTLLTESALGRYMDTIKRSLKNRQRKHIEEHVMEAALLKELTALSNALDQNNLFSQQLETELANAVSSSASR